MTREQNRRPRINGLVGIGALAGAFTGLFFTALHQLVISAIWFCPS
jgi:hypothetical protein